MLSTIVHLNRATVTRITSVLFRNWMWWMDMYGDWSGWIMMLLCYPRYSDTKLASPELFPHTKSLTTTTTINVNEWPLRIQITKEKSCILWNPITRKVVQKGMSIWGTTCINVCVSILTTVNSFLSIKWVFLLAHTGRYMKEYEETKRLFF